MHKLDGTLPVGIDIADPDGGLIDGLMNPS
jgi:hypothetical protein